MRAAVGRASNEPYTVQSSVSDMRGLRERQALFDDIEKLIEFILPPPSLSNDLYWLESAQGGLAQETREWLERIEVFCVSLDNVE